VAVGSSKTLTATGIADGNAGATIAQVAFYLDSNNIFLYSGDGRRTGTPEGPPQETVPERHQVNGKKALLVYKSRCRR
jgi:hypothetical protein